MRSQVALCVALFGSLLLPPWTSHLQGEEPATNLRVAALVKSLGSESYTEREAADAELVALGFDCRRELESASRSTNPEIQLRAANILRRLRAKELWHPAQIQVQAHAAPATTALNALMEQTGNRLVRGDSYGTFKDEKVTLDGGPSEFWRVLDSVCRQSGNHVRPHYDTREPGLVIVGGPPGKNPVAYAGPLRAQLTSARRVYIEELDYDERKSEVTHTFQLNLQMMWEDRLQLVGFRSQPELVAAVTDTGAKLTAAPISSNGWNVAGTGTRQLTAGLRLSPPPASAKKLDRLTLKWSLIAMGDLAALDVTDLDNRKSVCQDDVELRIEEFEDRASGRYDVTVVVARDLIVPDPQEILFRENQLDLFDAEGKPLRAQSQSNVLTDKGARFKITFTADSTQGAPKTLRLTYPRIRGQHDLPITFHDVPLPAGKPE